jgi:hypothetical protein
MSGVYGHDHIVQKSERESITEKSLHQREIKADAHAILMALAVVGAGRKKSAIVKIDIEIELSLARCELRGERAFVIFVNSAIKRC